MKYGIDDFVIINSSMKVSKKPGGNRQWRKR
jgi:hypothetical protein